MLLYHLDSSSKKIQDDHFWVYELQQCFHFRFQSIRVKQESYNLNQCFQQINKAFKARASVPTQVSQKSQEYRQDFDFGTTFEEEEAASSLFRDYSHTQMLVFQMKLNYAARLRLRV